MRVKTDKHLAGTQEVLLQRAVLRLSVSGYRGEGTDESYNGLGQKMAQHRLYYILFLSGICAISSRIIVSILQGKYEFDYGMTGTMLGLMSIGNMAASFAAGILPQKIGVKNTVLLLCSGYFLGYFLMAVTGMPAVLMAAFLLVGFAKEGHSIIAQSL